MGYTTSFDGEVTITPPLNAAEITYLKKFNETRRMNRGFGPYFVDGSGSYGQAQDDDIIDYNRPHETQPGLWCKWVPSESGAAIVWDGGEKFYEAGEWMIYLINNFLKPGAEAYKSSDPQFNEFTFDHVCEGIIYAQGEDPDDVYRIVAHENEVTVQTPEIVWPDVPDREETT